MSTWTGIIAGIAFIAILIYLLRVGIKSAGSGESLETELIRLCRGDKEMAERLISLEQSRGNQKDRKAAVRAAIYSFKRDNR